MISAELNYFTHKLLNNSLLDFSPNGWLDSPSRNYYFRLN